MSVGFKAGEKGNIFSVTECLQSMCRPLAGHKHTWSTNLCHHNNTKSNFLTKFMWRGENSVKYLFLAWFMRSDTCSCLRKGWGQMFARGKETNARINA